MKQAIGYQGCIPHTWSSRTCAGSISGVERQDGTKWITCILHTVYTSCYGAVRVQYVYYIVTHEAHRIEPLYVIVSTVLIYIVCKNFAVVFQIDQSRDYSLGRSMIIMFTVINTACSAGRGMWSFKEFFH
jgi:hypothetical protein